MKISLYVIIFISLFMLRFNVYAEVDANTFINLMIDNISKPNGSQDTLNLVKDNPNAASEALKILRNMASSGDNNSNVYRMLVNALEKEIPKLLRGKTADRSNNVAKLRINAAPGITIEIEDTLDTVDPVFNLDVQNHILTINKLVAEKNGQWIATGSDDKTIRIWDVRQGKQTNVLRPPVGNGRSGRITSIAIAPNGNIIAAGATMKVIDDFPPIQNGDIIKATSNDIFLFSKNNGHIIGRYPGLSSKIKATTFSNDNKLLAIGLQDGGIKIFSVINTDLDVHSIQLKLIAEADSDNITDISFSPVENILVTVSYGGVVKLYNCNTFIPDKNDRPSHVKPIYQRSYPNHHIESAAYSPDGSKIAVGFSNTLKIDILSAHDLSTLYFPSMPETNSGGSLYNVAWSHDGNMLLAAGDYRDSGKFMVRYWSDAGRGIYKDISTENSGITGLVALPDNSLIVADMEPRIAQYTINGLKKWIIKPDKADFRGIWASDALKVSEDGRTVAFSYGYMGKNAVFSLTNNTLYTNDAVVSELSSKLYSPETKSLDIDNWANELTTQLTLNKKKLRIFNIIESSRCVAISPRKDSFVLGSDLFIRKIDTTGKEIWNIETYKSAWGIIVTPDNKFAIATLEDGSIRWYRYSDGQEVLALFPHADKKRWVLWTPEGFFDGAKGAENFIGWNINKSVDKESTFISGGSLYNIFYRPDLVQAKFDGKLVAHFATDIDIKQIAKANTLPPRIRLLTQSGTSIKADMALHGEVCDNGGGIGDITIYLDDMPIVIESQERGLKIVPKASSSCIKFDKLITLQNGANNIGISAFNKNNTIESNRDLISISYKVNDNKKPALHILAVAVNNYRDGDLRLKYAVNDAKSIVDTIKKKNGKLFDKINVTQLFDAEVTKSKLDAIIKQVGKAINRNDAFILFIAGHGITNKQDGAYYFIPHDFRYNDEGSVTKQGISENDFKHYLTNIQATKSLLLIDTCNSGSFAEAIASRGMVEKTAVNKLVRAVGRATIVASSKDQVALEGYEGHGVFTWTVLEGFKGKAAMPDGRITVNSLATYIEETLPIITYKKWGYEQIPQKSLLGMDFPVGMK